MPSPSGKKPTDAELAILRVLWARGPSTVREVAREMGRESAYTTILKLLQIMTEKSLVRRDESPRTHVYEAAWTEGQTQQQLIRDLLERVFDGSAATLVMQALAAKKTSRKELAEIRKLLDQQTGRTPMNPWTHVIGWTLIHFFWQGAILAIAAAGRLAVVSEPIGQHSICHRLCRPRGHVGGADCERTRPDDAWSSHRARRRPVSTQPRRLKSHRLLFAAGRSTMRFRWTRCGAA